MTRGIAVGLPDHSCVYCGETYPPKRRNQKYCSTSCKDKFKYHDPSFKGVRQKLHKKWAMENKDKRRDYHYRTRFGITLVEYDEMFAAQGRVCAVCGVAPKVNQRAFAVDHDHKTGEIFGILCVRCNHRLIADIRDPDIYLKASDYLRKGSGRFVPEGMVKPKKKKRVRRPRKVKT